MSTTSTLDRLAALDGFDLVEAREPRQVRQARWRQAVLRKSATDTGAEPDILEQARKLDPGAGLDRRATQTFVTTSRGRPTPRRAGRVRIAAVFASSLLVATVAGLFLLRSPTPKPDQPQQTWVTAPPT